MFVAIVILVVAAVITGALVYRNNQKKLDPGIEKIKKQFE